MPVPERIKCSITNWNYIYDLCRDLSQNVIKSHYEPDIVIALARGGWFAGRMVCDFLGISDLISLKVEHYVGTALLADQCTVRYPITDEMVHGKRVLVVDDIADTGKSLEHSVRYINEFRPADCKTGVLQLLFTSETTPDFYAEFLEEWAWIVYPWNFIEDMIDLISKLLAKETRDTWDLKAIKAGLNHWYSIDPIHLDIAQPGRLPEIMNEMDRRGLIERVEGGWTPR